MTNEVESIGRYLEPLRKSITVQRTAKEAFELFTRMDRWWPFKQYSISQDRTERCVMEPRVGGRVYEVRDDGETFDWGRVLIWEPPRRLVLAWHPGREPETAQEVEFQFTDLGGVTRVDLEHREWARLGEKAVETRANYKSGWETVLGRFSDAAVGERA